MSLINIQNLTFAYDCGTQDIFKDVSFQIDTNWKLGLVGRNGRGKTTFLKLLMKEFEYQGTISGTMQFTYFPYLIKEQNKLVCNIMEELCPTAEEWEILREFSFLQLDYDNYQSTFSTLSNGEKTKILLAGLFLNENNYLLIDEPTNHLDSQGRKVLANYLRKKKSFILVSHDRYFLDMCTDHILSINKSNIEVQKGNFSSWFNNFNATQAFEEAQNEQLKKEIARLSKATKRTSEWADKVESSKYGNGPVDRGFIGHKSAKMMKRAKATENRQLKSIEQKSELLQNTERMEELKITCLPYHNDKLINTNNLKIFYDGNSICEHIELTIKQGDRLLLNGKNGCGKSSLLKLIVGENIEYSGNITIPNDLKISYIPQNADNLRGSLTNFSLENNIDQALFRAILNKMGFDTKEQIEDIEKLSEGQKKKILLAKSLSEKAHLYVWDEPLNYLDIFTRMQIENLLKNTELSIVFVEHDIAFGQKIANKIYNF